MSISLRAPAFQSTLPVWGGTVQRLYYQQYSENFNPPSPCGEGHLPSLLPLYLIKISIHPPRVGRDAWLRSLNRQARKFQSTLPVWGGTL